MFKIPNPPDPQSDPHELADFVELICWKQGSVSKQEILTYFNQAEDNAHNSGCDDDEDTNSEKLDEVMNEIERRMTACGDGYPFLLKPVGTVLKSKFNIKNDKFVLYIYLLLSTRLDMKSSRIHAKIDGALLFEEVCAHVLKNYLGGSTAKALVFGTATKGSFKNKVETLCKELHEGAGFKNPNSAPVFDKDGKLDVVAWVPFSDLSVGQLIIFCQCKTGTAWEEDVAKLNPSAFISKWIDGTIAVLPVRSFCVSEACNRSRWNSLCIDAGLLFDRCRLVDFCDVMELNLKKNILNWTSSAATTATY